MTVLLAMDTIKIHALQSDLQARVKSCGSETALNESEEEKKKHETH